MLSDVFLAFILKNKPVPLITTADEVAFLCPEHNLSYAFVFLNQVGFSEIPVLDSENHLKGYISLRDIFSGVCRLISKNDDTPSLDYMPFIPNYKVEDVMRPPEKIFTFSSTIASIYRALASRNYICICDDEGKFLGIVTRKAIFDLINKFLRESPQLFSMDISDRCLVKNFEKLNQIATWYNRNPNGLQLRLFCDELFFDKKSGTILLQSQKQDEKAIN